MFNVDDYIMYGMTGVCKVVDITNEKFINGEKRKYYVLNPIYNNDTTIKVPLDNDKIPMRKVISKGDMTSLINDIPNMEILWIDDEKKRMAQFETMLKSGQCEELTKLIKNIKFSKKYARSNDKKLYKSDKDIMKEAKRLLTEEFAIILNIYPKEANSYILSQIH
ncbi:CarD family transcriptional regulator [Paraclostridium sordellii]|uniref:CarD family transcriptional regulator n=1 Tax=Paraclostridium sordellii TaxID=1505 RepID=UPI0005E56267|nr:CarD family transcriptional regulator [Paeniclostridium sordellii]CEP80553.1 regulatory protein [[Clostridium] sordellii] [Paeniclostridium sordellii]